MKPKKFIDPSAIGNASPEILYREYEKLFFAYRDLLHDHEKLKREHSKKGTVVRTKGERLRGQYQNLVNGGVIRHQPTRAASQFFIARYWELKNREEEIGELGAKMLIRDLDNWMQNPVSAYGIELGPTPPRAIKDSTCVRLFTACNNAFRVCGGDINRFIPEVSKQRKRK